MRGLRRAAARLETNAGIADALGVERTGRPRFEPHGVAMDQPRERVRCKRNVAMRVLWLADVDGMHHVRYRVMPRSAVLGVVPEPLGIVRRNDGRERKALGEVLRGAFVVGEDERASRRRYRAAVTHADCQVPENLTTSPRRASPFHACNANGESVCRL